MQAELTDNTSVCWSVMTHSRFVAMLNGKRWRHTRTQLATQWVSDNGLVEPCNATTDESGSSIHLANCIYVYEEKDLYTEDYGILVAVVKSGAGHLWCDRFVPVETEPPASVVKVG